jgi:glycosyltransferase involved in cell wall biosynthesis
MTVPTISVVIPAYKCAAFLPEAIESALAQEGPPVEVVVVNDGSPDDTDAAVAAYRERIVYLRQENRGLSAARNVGFRASRGDFLCFLDADDILLPGKVEGQLAVFEREPDLGVVISGYVDVEEDGRGEIQHVRKDWNRDGLKRLLRHEVFPPHTALIRREVLEASSLFPEDIDTWESQEDWQLWLELALKGVEFGSYPEPTCLYRFRRGSIRQSPLRHLDGARRVVRWLRSHPRYAELHDEIEALHAIVEMERVARAFACGAVDEAGESLVREAGTHTDFWSRPATMMRLFERSLSLPEGNAWSGCPDPNFFEARVLRGILPLADGNLSSALRRRLWAAAWLTLADIHYAKGSHSGAVTMVRRAISQSPSVVVRWGLLTAIRAALGPGLGSILGAAQRAVRTGAERT